MQTSDASAAGKFDLILLVSAVVMSISAGISAVEDIPNLGVSCMQTETV